MKALTVSDDHTSLPHRRKLTRGDRLSSAHGRLMKDSVESGIGGDADEFE
jgi:hypothetical protein